MTRRRPTTRPPLWNSTSQIHVLPPVAEFPPADLKSLGISHWGRFTVTTTIDRHLGIPTSAPSRVEPTARGATALRHVPDRPCGTYGPLAAARRPRWGGRSPLTVEEPHRGGSRASPTAGGTLVPAATCARSSAVARARRAAPAPTDPRSEAWRIRASPWCAHAPIMLRLRRRRGREERRVKGQPAGEKNRRLVHTFLEGKTRQPPGGAGRGGRADANHHDGGLWGRTSTHTP